MMTIKPVLVLALFVVFIGGQRVDDAAGQTGPSVSISEEIRARVQSAGFARVLVELRMPSGVFIPEGDLAAPAAVAAQRADIAAAQGQVLALLQTAAHRVVRQYSTVPFIALAIDDDGLRVLEAAVFVVTRVVEDQIVDPVLQQSGPLVQADQAWARGFEGGGLTVAILDTGVDSNHPFLAGKVVEEACYSSSGHCPNGQDSQTGPGAGAPCPLEGCDHGTHVAGIAAGNGDTAGTTFSGVAKGASLMSVQVFSDTGGGASGAFYSDIMAGLERVLTLRTRHRFSSVNMSLGGGRHTAPCNNDPLKRAIDNLRSFAIATVIASGNSGYVDALAAPACIPTAVSVGATSKSDGVAGFSNVASFMSLFAPGLSIRSSVPGNQFAVFSGTSMAAPHVAGAWAVLKEAVPDASVAEIQSALGDTGLPIADRRSGGTATRPRIRVADALDQLTGDADADTSPPPGERPGLPLPLVEGPR